MIPVTPAPVLRTRQQARAHITSLGLSVREWAQAHNLSPDNVTALLCGNSKGVRGQAHDAAVLLGMKVGVVGGLATLADAPQAGAADKRRRPEMAKQA